MFELFFNAETPEETFFDLLAANGDTFQSAVDEFRGLGIQVADLRILTNDDILKLNSMYIIYTYKFIPKIHLAPSLSAFCLFHAESKNFGKLLDLRGVNIFLLL